jgi:WD40 repeat protein
MYKWLAGFLLLFPMLITHAQEPRLMLPIGHSGSVSSVQFSPDDAKVVTASDDNTAKIWDAENGRLLVELKGHVGKINTAKFSPDGTKIVTASSDSTLILWEVQSGNIVHEMEGHSGIVAWAEISPDGSKIVSASRDHTIKIWSVANGEVLFTITENNTQFQSVQFLKDGEQLVTTSLNEPPAIWNVQNGQKVISLKWKYREGPVYACINKEGSIIYTAGYDHIGTSWDTKTGELLQELNIPKGEVSSFQLSPDAQYFLATFWGKNPIVWNIETGVAAKEIDPEGNSSSGFSNNGKKMVLGMVAGTAQIRDLASGMLLTDLKGYTRPGGLKMFSPDGSKFLITANIDDFSVWDATNFSQNFSMKIPFHPLNRMDFSPDGKTILISPGSDTAFLLDSHTGERVQNLKGLSMSVQQPDFSRDGKKILTMAYDSVARVWNAASGELILEIRDSLNPISTAEMSEDGNKILTVHRDETVDIRNGSDGSLIAKLDDIINGLQSAQFSPDGLKVLTSIRNVASLWDAQTGVKITDFRGYEFKGMPLFSPDGKKFIINTRKQSALVFDTANLEPPLVLKADQGDFYHFAFSSDGQEITTAIYGNLVQVWNSADGKQLREIPLGVNTLFEDLNLKEDKILASNNSELRLISYSSGKEMISFYMVDSTDWSVVHASGLFDASPGAMEKMYWVKGIEIIELSQLKDRYYQPGLWKMVMDGKSLRSVEGMGALKMQPDVEVSEPQNGVVTIRLNKRDGGYGKVSVFVNNKEALEDARPASFDTTKPTQTIIVNLSAWLIPDYENAISVKAQSADGFLTGRAITVNFGKPSQSQKGKPSFYAIVCGTGQYSTPAITLKYPVPDAKAIADAIRIGANNLFGTDSAHVYLLTSPGEKPTTKKNIQNTFSEVKNKAKPDDIVLVYLSGHGVTWGGEKGDFFYLTNEASSKDADGYKDPVIRQKQTISTKEFTTWLNAIPALKQVMIIDACGSGKAVDNLISKRDIDASQIKAIDRMKDRTGLYIISGCAADAESYESSIYGQGLLTYAILEAMKGSALKENKYVDIYKMLDHAREQVPKYAMGLGGIQTPQLLMPRGGSFDIGIINESDKQKIPLAGVKKVFTRTMVQDKDKMRDVLKLSKSIDEKLNELATPIDGKGTIVFIDAGEFPDGCNISGVYQVKAGLIDFTGFMVCGEAETKIEFEKMTKEKLLEELMKIVAKMGEDADMIKRAM